jgi:alpha-tubulin suppressor-like RCC1 family protein/pimeloyl-ACP methyl ester carboxylesterase
VLAYRRHIAGLVLVLVLVLLVVAQSQIGTVRANPLSNIVALATGDSHSCALSGSGGVKCWGAGYGGQLGNGEADHSLVPVDVIGLTNGVTAIAAGGSHTCALTVSGGVKCWGNNSSGELGDGTTTDRDTPVDVVGLNSGVAAITAGYSHTCALTDAGAVKCWGFNGGGGVGDGRVCGYYCLSPVDVTGLRDRATAITAGDRHTCALMSGGDVTCWGPNENGQLGNGVDDGPEWCPPPCSTVPISVHGLPPGVTSLTAGGDHTCALTASDQVWCWGANVGGELGDGTTEQRNTPVNVTALDEGVTQIAAGSQFTCAIIAGNGVRCWGSNNLGQLGNGEDVGTEVCGLINQPCSTHPVKVVSLDASVTNIAAGGGHACAVGTVGTVKCWGWNYSGQLGIGSSSAHDNRVPLDVVVQVKVGTPLPSPTSMPTLTPTPPAPLQQKVLLITGIGIFGNCEIGEAAWMEDFLTTTGWVQLTAGLSDSDFMQYDYTSGDDNWQGCGSGNNFAQFTNLDSCWSLDDHYLDGLSIERSLRGQARRLADFIDSLPENYRVTIVGHSQGGVLATYAVHDFIGLDNRDKIKAIVTLDSPLGGIETLSAPLIQARWGCANLDARYDSAYDMQPGSVVVRRIHTQGSELPAVRLYTVNETGLDNVLGASVELIDDDHSRIRGWESSHLEVFTGDHSTLWNGQGNIAGTEVVKNYIGCAVAGLTPASSCEPFATGVERIAVSPNEVSFKDVNVSDGTERLTVLTAWPGSTITTSLVSPGGRVIDSNTTDAGIKHDANATSEEYVVEQPEPGTWRLRLYGTAVGQAGEEANVGVFIEAPTAFTATPTVAVTATPAAVVGDANCDGSVSSIDAALILQFAAGLIRSLSCSGPADTNRDGSVNAVDAALVLQYAAGIIQHLPA